MAGVSIAGAAVSIAPAMAQSAVSGGIEASTDNARRGISWSEGRVALAGDAFASIGPIDASARVATTRGSDRAAGADAVFDLSLGTGWDMGAVRMRATATSHLFAGARTNMDYVELGGSGSYSYGPLQLTLGGMFAPSQRAIGGSNLYVYADANAGIPGTPLTVIASLGHSSGSVDDPVRAQRLRPGGSYADWRLGVEHRKGVLTLGVDYIGTDISRADAFGPYADARHARDRVMGRVRLDF